MLKHKVVINTAHNFHFLRCMAVPVTTSLLLTLGACARGTVVVNPRRMREGYCSRSVCLLQEIRRILQTNAVLHVRTCAMKLTAAVQSEIIDGEIHKCTR